MSQQYWILLDLDKSICAWLGKQREFFFSDWPSELLCQRLRAPSWKDESVESFVSGLPSITCGTGKHIPLQHLPKEVLFVIIGYVEDLHDLVCLCLVDKTLFSVGFPRLLEMQKAASASWIGDKLICLGDEYASVGIPVGIRSYFQRDLQGRDKTEFWSIVTNKYRQLQEPEEDEQTISDDPIQPRENTQFVKKLKIDGEYEIYETLLIPKFESNSPWVLCDSSKAAYIREDEVNKIPGSESDAGGWNLGHALLLRIFWSEGVELDGCDGEFGAWAGDGFVITTMDKMDKGLNWSDVTEEVTVALKEIGKCCEF